MTTPPDGSDLALVVGGYGTIGQALLDRFRGEGLVVLSTWFNGRPEGVSTRSYFLDLSKDDSSWNLPKEPIDIAVLCAGITSVEKCEEDPEATRRINVHGTLALAEKLAAQGAFIVFLSSDRVFSGRTLFPGVGDQPEPASQYGLQKVEVEAGLSVLGEEFAVVRLGKVIGPTTPIFASWLSDLRSGRQIRPFNDFFFAPISLRCAVNLIVDISVNRRSGIFHATAPDDVSYADAARWLADAVGARQALVEPVSGQEVLMTQVLPRSVALSTTLDLVRYGPIGLESLCELVDREPVEKMNPS